MSNYNLKSIKQDFKDKGIFYTTNEMALMLKKFIDIGINEVYDPTCGDGSLLSVFEDNVIKYGQEINESQLKVAQSRLVNFNGFCGDTLKSPYFLDRKFKCIVANPPFSIKWEPLLDERFEKLPALPPKSKADYAFILHILHLLKDDGIAIVLEFPGILYRGNSEGKIREYLIRNNYIEKVVRIQGKKFIDTTIETCLIVFKKNKNHTNIEFIDSETGVNHIATFKEIEENNFILSINTYVKKYVEKINYNPINLNADARDKMILKLRKDIEFDKMVCKLEGYDFNGYIQSIKQLIKEYEQ